MFVISGCGIALANFVDLTWGSWSLFRASWCCWSSRPWGVAVSKVIPLKLPVVAYVSIIGLLAACPVSPCREFVIDAAGKINFTAPLTMVGAYAGISISDQIKSFLKQGWKMILVGVFVMTGTFVGSALIAHVVLKITGAI